MQTSHTFQNETETAAWAQAIGSRLRGGEVVELIGDLGSGKTTVVKAVAAGAGSSAHVSSPTFTISKHYAVPERPGRKLRSLIHADLYRLHDPGLMMYELTESIADPTVTVLLEWGAAVADILPAERLTLELSVTGDHSRRIKVTYPDKLAYLVEPAS